MSTDENMPLKATQHYLVGRLVRVVWMGDAEIGLRVRDCCETETVVLETISKFSCQKRTEEKPEEARPSP